MERGASAAGGVKSLECKLGYAERGNRERGLHATSAMYKNV